MKSKIFIDIYRYHLYFHQLYEDIFISYFYAICRSVYLFMLSDPSDAASIQLTQKLCLFLLDKEKARGQ